MIGYWKEFFYDPTNPETYRYLIDYVTWMAYAYPMFLLQLPLVTFILLVTFRPEYRDLSRAVVKLRAEVELQGPLKPGDWIAILISLWFWPAGSPSPPILAWGPWPCWALSDS